VHLDKSLDEFFPSFQGKEIGLVTLKELSTHTSGLPPIPSNMYPFKDHDNPYKSYSSF
jgi:CubicO group peptidase (beta-lactamase class C family)